MNRTNIKLAATTFALSAGGTSGFSLMVLSYSLHAPDDWVVQGGNFVVALTNAASTAPLLVELRSTWTDLNGVSQTTPVMTTLVSNLQTFGGTALQGRQQTLLTSGQGALLPYAGVAGSAVQVWVLAASTVSDGAGCSGSVTLWAI